MRRIKLFVACCLLIVAALPLLPGPGTLVIAEMIATLEREFPWVRPRRHHKCDAVHDWVT